MSSEAQVWQFDEPGGPRGLELRAEPIDEPGPGEALVRVHAIGVNRSDLLHLAGRYYGPPPSPSCLGHEAVGEVVALGRRVDADEPVGFTPTVGERVALLAGRVDIGGMGAFRTVGRYRRDALLPVPSRLSDAEGAAYWLAAITSVGALRVAGMTPATAADRTVLVTAATSGVGVTAAQAARAWGARVIATTTSADKADALADLADHVVVVHEPAALADSGPVDVALDAVGSPYTAALVDALAPEGSVVTYGTLGGTAASVDLVPLIQKDAALHGFTIHRLLRQPAQLDQVVLECLRLGNDRAVVPRIADVMPFADAPAALERMSRNEHIGKLVLSIP